MGSFSILNNIPAIYAQTQLGITRTSLSQTINRLSSGKRINSGADDAAGLQIADSLRANTFALNQAVRNANDAIGVSQIADGALQEITNLLTRSVTLAEEAATSTVDKTGRESLDGEFIQIQAEIARIANQTNFNGQTIFKKGEGINGNLIVFVGDIMGPSSIAVSISSISTSTDPDTDMATVIALGDANLTNVDLTDISKAATSITEIKKAIEGVSHMRSEIGAGMNRLQSAVSVLQSQSINTQSAESVIRDANVAEEVANLTKYQILAQSGISALAQANVNSQQVLALIRR